MSLSPPKIVTRSTELLEADPVAFLLNQHCEHGDVFAVEMDGVPTAIFGGAAGPVTMFRAERNHLAVYNTPLVHELFGQAIFNLVGDSHRRARKLLRQAVAGTSLRKLTTSLAALVARHVARWSDLGTFDLHEGIRELTLEVCSRLILGLQSGSDDDRNFSVLFAEFVAAAVADSDTRGANPTYSCGVAAADGLRAMIDRRVTAATVAPGLDVLSHLASSKELGASDMGDHLLAMMIAARETTASLITWVLIELAQAPDTAQIAANELHERGGDLTATIQAVLLEAERRHSPNVLSRRTVITELSTPYGHVPKGWHIAYSPAVNHLLPSLFDNPQCFRPERFAGQFGMRRARGLLTFGQGAHACPGKSLAELVAITVVATVLRAHRLALIDPLPERVRYFPVKTPGGSVRAILQHRS